MKKKQLSKKVGLDFNEIKDILSEETLSSFELGDVKGGGGAGTDDLFTGCISCVKDCSCAPQDKLCVGACAC